MLNASKISDLQDCRTNRLLLRRPSNDHLQVVVAIHGDPETNQFNPSGPASTEDSTSMLSSWLSHWDDHGFGYWSVSTIQEPSQIIGFGGVMLKRIGDIEAPNLYFRFTPKVWGKGYATEVGSAAIHSAFHLLNYSEVRAVVRPDNLPSRSALGRLGMLQIGEINDSPGLEPSLLYNLSRMQVENAT